MPEDEQNENYQAYANAARGDSHANMKRCPKYIVMASLLRVTNEYELVGKEDIEIAGDFTVDIEEDSEDD